MGCGIQDTKSPGEEELTAEWKQAQVQRQTFPVMNYVRLILENFLWCFVCFWDFFKNKQTKR